MRGSFILGGMAVIMGFGAFVPVVAAKEAPNSRGQAELARLIADRVPGKPVDCINLADIQSTEVLDGTAIVYRVGGDKIYINRPASGSDWLASDDILITTSSTPQLCRVDIVRLVERGSLFERGSIGLGDFVPYTKPTETNASRNPRS